MEIVSGRDTFLIMLSLFNCNLCLSLLCSVEPFPLGSHCAPQAHPNSVGELASSPALQPLALGRINLSCSKLYHCSWAGLWGRSDADLAVEASRRILQLRLKLQSCSGAFE